MILKSCSLNTSNNDATPPPPSISFFFFLICRQVTGERERCYLVGLETSGWDMGGKRGTKGSFPEARVVNGE